MAGTFLTVEAIPPVEVVAKKYDDVADVMKNLTGPFRDVIDLLEETHERAFARLRGRYVRTGATKDSLTGSSAGAIRDADRDGLQFGTSIWYAHFLTKAPKDPNLGQVPKANKPHLKHAVLVFPKATQKHVADMLIGRIAEPFGE
jgi:hypothetical protein